MLLEIIVGVLSVSIMLLIIYIILSQLQLRNINRQLTKRLAEHTRQPISLQLVNKELNTLAININKCLKAEEFLRLEELRKEKHFKELIADISHDLRTPLTAIKGYQQLIKKEALSEAQLQKLQTAEKHTEELGKLIEHFFEYSYLLNFEPVLQTEKINVTNLIADCLAESVALLEDNNLMVHFTETQPIFIMTDRAMTIRIIRNLIRNCIQHSNSDIEVTITSKENVIICFKNSVKNPSEIDLSQLFHRFYTADKARSKSTGLGLAIVKLLAQQMGGSTNASLENEILEIQVHLPVK